MRVLWISFLLIGSISCFPQQGASGGGKPLWWYSASPGQAPFQPAYEKPAEQSSGSVGYSGYPEQSSGSVGYSGYPELYYVGSTNTAGGESGSPYGGHSVPQVSQHGSPGSSGTYQQTEESWSSSDTSGEDEPVFTPVEDEDQVYAFKSRSRYNRNRLLFNQFRYTPTEPRDLEEPTFLPHQPGKKHHHKSDYVKG